VLTVLQDGQAIKVSERIAAAQVLDSLEQQLLQELAAEGVDVAAAAGVEDDSSIPDGEVAETGFVDEAGELRRPWCPATRILEHREMVRSCTRGALHRRGRTLQAP
jgi:protein TilB